MLGSGDRDPFPGSQLELGVTVVLPSASIYRSGHNVFGVRDPLWLEVCHIVYYAQSIKRLTP